MMKNLFLAGALALLASTSAFASVIIYSDGSKYDTETGFTIPPPTKYAMGGPNAVTDVPVWRKHEGTKVIRFGPPTGGLGGF